MICSIRAQHPQAQRQPGVDAGRGPADVAGADEQPVARHLGVRRVLAQGPHEQGRHPQNHAARLLAGLAAVREPVAGACSPTAVRCASPRRRARRRHSSREPVEVTSPCPPRRRRPSSSASARTRRRRAGRRSSSPSSSTAGPTSRVPHLDGQDRRRRRSAGPPRVRRRASARQVGDDYVVAPEQPRRHRKSGSCGSPRRASARCVPRRAGLGADAGPTATQVAAALAGGSRTRIRVLDATHRQRSSRRVGFARLASGARRRTDPDGAQQLARPRRSGGTPSSDCDQAGPTATATQPTSGRTGCDVVHEGPVPGRLHGHVSLSDPDTRLWRQLRPGGASFSPSGERITTVYLLADGLGPRRGAGCASRRQAARPLLDVARSAGVESRESDDSAADAGPRRSSRTAVRRGACSTAATPDLEADPDRGLSTVPVSCCGRSHGDPDHRQLQGQPAVGDRLEPGVADCGGRRRPS